MGADTIYQQLRSHLAYLKLGAAADALAPALEAAERDKPGYTQFLHDLLATEVAASEQRRLGGRMRFSKLPAHKTLEQFDFTAQPTLDRRLVEDLATLRFVEEKSNCLMIGPPGVGKTHLAIALGHKAVHVGYRVYYTTAADLVARTSRAAMDGRWANTMRFWAGPQVLIVDELEYLPMPGEAASQPRHRRLGPHLRRHHRRDRSPRPAPAPRQRAHHEGNAGSYRLTVGVRGSARTVDRCRRGPGRRAGS
jgi:DNA replication protein DnaC